MADEKNPFPGEDNTGHVWDDNIRELNNPVPRWWMIGFWASIAWVVVYALLYPMIPLANDYTRGLLGWTQIEEMEDGIEQVQEVRGPFETRIENLSTEEILADQGLTQYTIASARVLFGDNCAGCHGASGQGNPGYPVLVDDNWLYSGAIGTIEESLRQGRQGLMIAFGDQLSDSEVNSLAELVMGWSQGEENAEAAKLFTEKGCAGCHGPEGRGNSMLGAANLRDAIWRFRAEDQLASVKRTIRYGVNAPGVAQTREAVMPSFSDRLGDAEIKKLAVYVYSLGGGQR